MRHENRIYDLHITVDPRTLDPSIIQHPWRVHDIYNVQGMPHFIISQKYSGSSPHEELTKMAEILEEKGVLILRRKIELHFASRVDVENLPAEGGIVEVHYKCKKQGFFGVSTEEAAELTKHKLALSFNRSTGRPIVSMRFVDIGTYIDSRAADQLLPTYLDEEEREIVIMDTNNELDSFWSIRTKEDERISFNNFSHRLPKLLLSL